MMGHRRSRTRRVRRRGRLFPVPIHRPQLFQHAQRRICDGRRVVFGQGHFDEAKVVLQDLWVHLHAAPPVLADALAVLLDGACQHGRRRGAAVVVGTLGADLVEVHRVGGFSRLGEGLEDLQDVFSCFCADPCSGGLLVPGLIEK